MQSPWGEGLVFSQCLEEWREHGRKHLMNEWTCMSLNHCSSVSSCSNIWHLKESIITKTYTHYASLHEFRYLWKRKQNHLQSGYFLLFRICYLFLQTVHFLCITCELIAILSEHFFPKYFIRCLVKKTSVCHSNILFASIRTQMEESEPPNTPHCPTPHPLPSEGWLASLLSEHHATKAKLWKRMPREFQFFFWNV